MLAAFLSLLSGGMLASLAMCRVQLMAWKFVRVVAVVAFVLAAGVVVWSLFGPPDAGGQVRGAGLYLTIAGGLFAFALMVLAPLVEPRAAACRMVAALGGACGLTAGCFWTVRLFQGAGADPASGWLGIIAGQLTGAWVIGAVTVAWLLGHAYLTASRMTIAPLRRLSRLLMAAVALRIVFVAASMAIGWVALGDGQPWAPRLLQSWLTLSLRIGVGLVGLGVFSYMVLDCVRLRSTQSATGILYFASIFAYIGELSSQHLSLSWGWPM